MVVLEGNNQFQIELLGCRVLRGQVLYISDNASLATSLLLFIMIWPLFSSKWD